MTHLRDYLIRWSMIAVHSVILVSLWCMLETRGLILGLPFGLLLAVLSALLLLDVLLTRSSASKAVYAIINVAAAAGSAFWLQSLLTLSSANLTARAVFSSVVILLATDTALMAPRVPKRGEIVLFFDISVIFEAFYIALSGGEILACSGTFMVWGLLACIMTLTSLASLRLRAAQKGESALRPVLTLAALIALAGLLFLLSLLALSELESVSSSLVGFLKRAVHAIGAFILKILTAIYDWFNSLFRQELVYEFDANMYSSEIESNVYREYSSGRWILIAALVLIFTALAVLIIRLRGKKWKRNRQQDDTSDDGKLTSSKTGLGRFLGRIGGKIGFMLRYMKGRNSAGGLFIWTERKLKVSGIRRRCDQSAHSFLRSNAEKVACTDDMRILADALEKQFYAGEKTDLPEGFAQRFRKNLKLSKPDPQARAQ